MISTRIRQVTDWYPMLSVYIGPKQRKIRKAENFFVLVISNYIHNDNLCLVQWFYEIVTPLVSKKASLSLASGSIYCCWRCWELDSVKGNLVSDWKIFWMNSQCKVVLKYRQYFRALSLIITFQVLKDPRCGTFRTSLTLFWLSPAV